MDFYEGLEVGRFWKLEVKIGHPKIFKTSNDIIAGNGRERFIT